MEIKKTMERYEGRAGNNQVRFTVTKQGVHVQRAIGPFDGPMVKIVGRKNGELAWYPKGTITLLNYVYFDTLEEAVKYVDSTQHTF